MIRLLPDFPTQNKKYYNILKQVENGNKKTIYNFISRHN